jgi:hypothetical protein
MVLDCLACSTYQEGGAGLGTLGLPESVARRMVARSGQESASTSLLTVPWSLI